MIAIAVGMLYKEAEEEIGAWTCYNYISLYSCMFNQFWFCLCQHVNSFRLNSFLSTPK